MPDRLTRQRFQFLALLLLLLFIFPLISLANKPVRIGGIPVLVIYCFAIWILAIALLYRNAERKKNSRSTHHE